jgi:hypothetical protein
MRIYNSKSDNWTLFKGTKIKQQQQQQQQQKEQLNDSFN